MALNEEERDFHRYLVSRVDGVLDDWRMRRLIFGITSSPFLATQVLQQVADEHQKDSHCCRTGKDYVYVDDVLTGTESMKQARMIREELNGLLGEAQIKLRKWQSDSKELLETVPIDLREKDWLQMLSDNCHGVKALGVIWNTDSDTLHVSVLPITLDRRAPTKREVASIAAKIFDVLGWFSPVVRIKILLQKIWEPGLGWDKTIPIHLQLTWEK